MARVVAAFQADVEGVLASLDNLLNHPGRDRAHAHVEAIRLVAQARESAAMRAEMLALNARREPLDVPLRRLADALQVSVNTVQSRISARATDQGDPFEPTPAIVREGASHA